MTAPSCRACVGHPLERVVSLGKLPLANSFPLTWPIADERRFETSLAICPSCGLVQLQELVEPDLLFSTYPWHSAVSSTARAYAASLAERIRGRFAEPDRSFVVEVGSNDGLLARAIHSHGFRVLAVDPSDAIEQAAGSGVETRRAFFDHRVGAEIAVAAGPADLIVARNVLGHTPDPISMACGFREMLHPDGYVLIEVPYVHFLRSLLQYDTVFHEHISYFSLTSLDRLLQRCGLRVERASLSPMNGGSLVCEARHIDRAEPDAGIELLRAVEDQDAIIRPEGWVEFASRVEANRAAMSALVGQLCSAGAEVAAYGAAAKTIALLNACGLDSSQVQMIADASPLKQGRFCPGVGIPVVSPDELLKAADWTHILIGPWNLAPEIINDLRGAGYAGDFIVPVPVPRMVS
jgi:hypothetical protein